MVFTAFSVGIVASLHMVLFAVSGWCSAQRRRSHARTGHYALTGWHNGKRQCITGDTAHLQTAPPPLPQTPHPLPRPYTVTTPDQCLPSSCASCALFLPLQPTVVTIAQSKSKITHVVAMLAMVVTSPCRCVLGSRAVPAIMTKLTNNHSTLCQHILAHAEQVLLLIQGLG